MPNPVPIPRRNDAARRRVAETAESRAAELIELSHRIHDDPELSWQEHRAVERITDVLRSSGFTIDTGAYDIDTAFVAEYGSGELTVALCAEYDALPDVGHACGHNVIAAIGVGAALSLAQVADAAGLRVKLLGTPAEEHGGGKAAMLAAGAWEDADFSMMVHGMTGPDRPAEGAQLTAVERFQVEYLGRAAHAAGFPQDGINAGAAASLAITAIAMLRQHISKDANLNAFISHGGEATNIIADRTVLQVEVRAQDVRTWTELKQRALKCFEGAAIATGCQWSWTRTEHPYAPMITEPMLAGLWNANLRDRGRSLDGPPVTGGSSDMGNVSQVVPAIHPMVSFLGETAVPHNAEFAAAAATPAADRAIIDGAIALAWTALDAATDDDVRAELLRRRAARGVGATIVPTNET